MYSDVKQPVRKLKWINTIEYDVKLYQVKKTIVNGIDLGLKLLKILTSHKIDVVI